MIQLNKIQSFLSKITIATALISFSILGTLAMVSFVSNMQTIDGSLGLMQTTKKSDYQVTQKAMLKALSGGEIKGQALIVALAPGGFEAVLPLLSAKMSGIASALIQPIVAIVEKLFSVIDTILDTLENIAEVLNGTRVAMGFLIYRDIEGSTGAGSTNFAGSLDFAKQLLGDNSNERSYFNSNFPKKDELTAIVADGVAWLDFMTVQRTMQNGLIGDFLTKNSKFDVFTGEDVKAQIKDVVLGTNCESAQAINTVPFFREYRSRFNSCESENIGDISTALETRKQSILSATQGKIEQYNVKPPADCKYGQYFEVTGNGAKVKYDAADRGKFGQIIASIGDNIKLTQIRADECEQIKNAKIQQANINAQQLQPVNLLFSTATPTGPLAFLETVVQTVVKDLWTKLQDRFTRALTIVTTISQGSGSGIALYSALFDIAFSAKAKIIKGINDLNKEFQNYQNDQLPKENQ